MYLYESLQCLDVCPDLGMDLYMWVRGCLSKFADINCVLLNNSNVLRRVAWLFFGFSVFTLLVDWPSFPSSHMWANSHHVLWPPDQRSPDITRVSSTLRLLKLFRLTWRWNRLSSETSSSELIHTPHTPSESPKPKNVIGIMWKLQERRATCCLGTGASNGT